MIIDNLFQTALIQPALDGADSLKIISGYATSAMAFHHLEENNRISKNINISLLVGMCPSDGISLSNHRGFQNILESGYSSLFSCSYIYKPPAVHSKAFIWYKDRQFYKSFIGSANYTQNAFFEKQRELLIESNSTDLASYYDVLEKESIYCDNLDTEELIKIYNDKHYYRQHRHEEKIKAGDSESLPGIEALDNVKVSLLGKNGEIQTKGGLNWGQRPGRDPNQAYIQLPPVVYKSDFFPLRAQHFTVVTDDNKTFICTRAQKTEEGHAIETPQNNSLLGEYFRNRLKLPNGAFIRKEDLENYGRTDVTFYKIDNENYYMDFSV
jgi:hypothetical protein